MDPLIRAAVLAEAPRRLARQPAGTVSMPVAPVAPVAAVAPPPAAVPAPAPQPDPAADAALEAVRREAAALATRQVTLDAEVDSLRAREAALTEAMQGLQQEADALRAEAQRAGLEEARAAAQAEAQEAVAAAVAAARQAAGLLLAQRQAQLADHEDMLVEIAFTAVCRMLGEQLVRRDGMAAMVRELLAQASAAPLCVRLHPDDAAWLGEGAAFGPGITLQPDAAIELGGCMLDGERGTLDARLELQVDALRAALLAARARRAQFEVAD
jgi:flagellar assembly protein FliH